MDPRSEHLSGLRLYFHVFAKRITPIRKFNGQNRSSHGSLRNGGNMFLSGRTAADVGLVEADAQ